MYENFEKLIKERGLTVYQVAKATGISQSTFSVWKKRNTTPKYETLKLIAEYFSVPIEYLTTGNMDAENKKYYVNDKTAEIAQKIFENKELSILFESAVDSTEDDLKTVHQMLLALKRKEN